MDQPQKEMPRKVYSEPTLEEREHLDEVVWGQLVLNSNGSANML